MRSIGAVVLVFVCLLLHQAVQEVKENDKVSVPAWVQENKSLGSAEIPQEDYAYLRQWVDQHAKPADQYMIDLFQRYQVVIFGESHNVKEYKDFIIGLIPRLYREAGVRCIGWEFSRFSDNERLNRLVTAEKFDAEGALDFARDQLAHEWNSKEHWDIIEAVWRLNHSLPGDQEKLRLIGLDMDLDMPGVMVALKSLAEDSPERKAMTSELLKRDRAMADNAAREIVERGKKGLLFVGRSHDFTHYEFPPDTNFGREIMGNLLHKRYGDRVFQVWPGPWGMSFLEKIMEGKADRLFGFDLFDSPFANIKSPKEFSDAPEVPMQKIARGFIYFGPAAALHRNTAIKGFVTDEMFRKYKHYYEVDLGHSFNNAGEVDAFLQEHRWPYPRPL